VTAVTDSLTAAQDGGALSRGVRHVAQDGPPEGRSAATARPVSTGGAATSAAALSHLSPQAAAAKRGSGADSSGQPHPGSATVGEASPELSAAARIEAIDGSERKLLLDQLARVHPDVVEAGFELVAQWRAECAERRRKNGRRHEHDRRRRRAEELGGG